MAGEPSDLGIMDGGRDEYLAGLRKRCSEELEELERRCQLSADERERAALRAEMDTVRDRYLQLERRAWFSLF
jgi:hypothetical protein